MHREEISVWVARRLLAAALAFGGALILVLLSNDISNPLIVLFAALAGAVASGIVAMKVNMSGIPAMVAFQHGMGGVAAFLFACVELSEGRDGHRDWQSLRTSGARDWGGHFRRQHDETQKEK